MKQRYKVEKPEEVKIIQVISHCPEVKTSHPTFSVTNYYKILGLGNDGNIYSHNDYENTWYREDLREVPDACTCNEQPMTMGGRMPCWFCIKGSFNEVLVATDKEIK